MNLLRCGATRTAILLARSPRQGLNQHIPSARQNMSSFISEALLPLAKGVALTAVLGAAVGVPASGYHLFNSVEWKVKKMFENPVPPNLIREGEHFSREKEEKEIKEAFLNRTDTLGLVGVIFGPAGTGKSNLVRTVCRHDETKTPKGRKGVIYMEVGSPRRFAYNLAKTCGIKLEPNLLDAIVSKVAPKWKMHLTLPDDEVDALACVMPVIEKGGKMYKRQNNEIVPVLFIDGADILAKQKDNTLYKSLVDWAKKCANDDSLQIVLVSSDSHILALDQQSFKSRLDDLIEIGDVEDETTQQRFIDTFTKKNYSFKGLHKFHVTELMKVNSWRLADVHKAIKSWKKTSRDTIESVTLREAKSVRSLYDSLVENVANELYRKKAKELAEGELAHAAKEVSERYPYIDIKREQIVVPEEVAKAFRHALRNNLDLRDEIFKAIPQDYGKPPLQDITENEEREKVLPILLQYFQVEHFLKELRVRYTREMRHALSKALGDTKSDQWELKLAVIKEVLDQDKGSKPHKDRQTVEQITWTVIKYFKAKGTHYSTNDVQEVIKDFLSYNVLRITKHRTLLCYNQFSKQVLKTFFEDHWPVAATNGGTDLPSQKHAKTTIK